MKQITLNEKKYKVERYTHATLKCDAFLYKGILYDTIQDNTIIKYYFVDEDNSVIGILSDARHMLRVATFAVICTVIMVLLILLTTFIINNSKHNSSKLKVKAVAYSEEGSTSRDNPFVIKKTGNGVTIQYQKYCTYFKKKVDLALVNGKKDATFTLVVGNKKSKEYSVKQGESIVNVDIDLNDTEFPVEGIIKYAVENKEFTYPVIIEDNSEISPTPTGSDKDERILKDD